jgi:hypothetical protein
MMSKVAGTRCGTRNRVVTTRALLHGLCALLLAGCANDGGNTAEQEPVRAAGRSEDGQLMPSLLTVLAVDTGEHVLGELSPVVSLGTDFVAISADRQRVLRFDPRGALIRTIGRSGAGPGEFERLSQLVPLHAGGLLIADGARYHVLDSALVLRRSFSAPSLACQHQLPGGVLLCLGLTSGNTFVLLDSAGARSDSFGQRTTDRCALCNSYVLFDADSSESVTIAAYRHHLIARWSPARGVTDTIVYSLPTPLDRLQVGESRDVAEQYADRLPDRTRLYGGWQDERGFIGLVASAPSTSKHAPDSGNRTVGRTPGRMTLDQMRSFSTTVFIVDSTGRPLWQTAFDGQRVLPIGVGLIARPRYDSRSFVEIEILRTPTPR